MEQKLFPLGNRGMSRDTSISKEKNEFAFENHNIRILARDHDTLLSVTNERGNKEVEGIRFRGTVIGWNVLNRYIIVFTTDDEADRIYRVEYNGSSDTHFKSILIYSGSKALGSTSYLGFDVEHPIESIMDFESEDIQKIYWIDGKNVLRFLNFSDTNLSKHLIDNTTLDNPTFYFEPDYFDSTRAASTDLTVKISRENGGNTRNNGTSQYFITYYNKNGQQTGIVYSSPLVYLSPEGRGGAEDETNTNKVIVEVNNVDTSFDYIRLYQIFRSSKDITNTAYLVSELSASSGSVTFVDSGVPQETVDVTSLLFLGSQNVHAGTMTAKDNTLFLGDLQSIGNIGIDALESAIKDNAFEEVEHGDMWESKIVSFEYSDNQSDNSCNIPYVKAEGYYPYENQLKYTNAQITTFKGGEKYRFALRFYRKNGTYSKAFWIGDKVNPYYPRITGSADNMSIQRVIAKCELPHTITEYAKLAGFSEAQLMIAEATYADRSVQAQGIVCPTLFNLYNRYNDIPYSQSSWIFRPKGGKYPSTHFSTLAPSNSQYAELQNSFWGDKGEPSPMYYLNNSTGDIINPPSGYPAYTAISIYYNFFRNGWERYWADMTVTYYNGNGTEEDPYVADKNATYSFHLGDRQNGELSKSETILDILNAYEETGVPDDLRLNEDSLRGLINQIPGPDLINWVRNKEHRLPETGEAERLDSTTKNKNTQFSKSSKAFYFVDENIVTLNSPELEYEAINIDRNPKIKFRIVGVARFTGAINDYSMQTSDFNYVGEKVLKTNFSSENISNSIEGMSAWPVYLESKIIRTSQEGNEEEIVIGDMPVSYMTYMWHKSGSIPEVTYNEKKLSILDKKLFANLHFSYYSVYNNYGQHSWSKDIDDLRQFNSVTPQMYGLKINGAEKSYVANVDEIASMPSTQKYPVYFSEVESFPGMKLSLDSDPECDTSAPISITYNSRPHAVIVLPKSENGDTILPYLFSSDRYTEPAVPSGAVGPYAPWKQSDSTPEVEPTPDQESYTLSSTYLPSGSKYMFIGELYMDYDGGDINKDTRYGGISENAVEKNTFIPAGPKEKLANEDSTTETLSIIGNEGDTFFQRWDSVKTVPRSETDTNQVVDIASVMLETHINIDGRTDKDRGSTKLTMIDWTNFGRLNPVYSQMNDFQKGFNTDESDNLDVYRSSVTWTLEKHPNADVDEWTHIPLTSVLKLDGDKGTISALRRFENSIIAFQEKGIAEILFNSRTQIATGDGVPIEIANSGKVEGKRYITNKYGTLNKWSIVEGKSGLYFVDNLNKIIGVLSGNGVKSLSTEQKFDAWVRDNHSTESWNPDTFDNFVSYYDRVHSDVYFIKSSKHNQPCLVYSEILGSFVSFYDYSDISMLTNIQDRFVSCRRDGYGNSRLWLQNEGLYGKFFGEDKDFWVTWRVAPDGYADKIWTGIEYRSDFMKVLNNMGDSIVPEDDLIDGNGDSIVADKTFDALEVWNEYQTTGEQAIPKRSLDMIADTYSDSVKRFRIWRIDIPRAIKSVTSGNKFGLDRIRNPWVYLKLKKNGGNFGQELMQLHDVVVKYFSEN